MECKMCGKEISSRGDFFTISIVKHEGGKPLKPETIAYVCLGCEDEAEEAVSVGLMGL